MNRISVGFGRAGLMVLAAVTASCATVGGLSNSEGDGETSYYREDPEVLLDAGVIALADLGLRIEKYDSESRYVLASKGASMGSYGEVVGVFVRQTAQDETVCSVRVVSRKRLATNVFAKNWEDDVFRRLEAQLDPETLLLASHGESPAPTLSGAELRNCIARTGASSADSLEHQGEVTVEVGPDLEVLNTCLEEARKDLP